MRELILYQGALAGADLEAAQNAVLGSPWVVGTGGSGGLKATFNTGGLAEICERFDFLAAFLDRALAPRSYRALWNGRERLIDWLASNRPNAFYLEVFLLGAGMSVAPRIATTLQRRVNAPFPYPKLVSVLFAHRPKGASGGALRLRRGERIVGEVTARSGDLVQFRGDLAHELTPVSGAIETPCVTFLCEQYSFAEPLAARLPPLSISSAPRFEACLAEARGRPTPDLLTDAPIAAARPGVDRLPDD